MGAADGAPRIRLAVALSRRLPRRIDFQLRAPHPLRRLALPVRPAGIAPPRLGREDLAADIARPQARIEPDATGFAGRAADLGHGRDLLRMAAVGRKSAVTHFYPFRSDLTPAASQQYICGLSRLH